MRRMHRFDLCDEHFLSEIPESNRSQLWLAIRTFLSFYPSSSFFFLALLCSQSEEKTFPFMLVFSCVSHFFETKIAVQKLRTKLRNFKKFFPFHRKRNVNPMTALEKVLHWLIIIKL